jgi:hypothetical protein
MYLFKIVHFYFVGAVYDGCKAPLRDRLNQAMSVFLLCCLRYLRLSGFQNGLARGGKRRTFL